MCVLTIEFKILLCNLRNELQKYIKSIQFDQLFIGKVFNFFVIFKSLKLSLVFFM